MKTRLVLTMTLTLAFGLSGCEKESSVTQVEMKRQQAAPAPQGSMVVAPVSSSTLTSRWNSGANAQTSLTRDSGRLKTGPNAQTDLTRDSGRLKTGPNAQTDLTLKKSW